MKPDSGKTKKILRLADTRSIEEISRLTGSSAHEVALALKKAGRMDLVDSWLSKEFEKRRKKAVGIFVGLLATVLFSLPLMNIQLFYRSAHVPARAVVETLPFLFLICWLFFGEKGDLKRLWSTVTTRLLLFFSGWVGLSVLWAGNRLDALMDIWHWQSGVVTALLVAIAPLSRTQIRILLNALFAGGLAVAFIGLCQSHFEVLWFDQAAPPASTFVNKNMAAQYMLLSIPAGLGLCIIALISSLRNWKIWLYGTGLSMGVAYLVLTYTRAAWLAFAVQLVFVFGWWIFEYLKSKNRSFQYLRHPVPRAALLLFILILFSGPNSILKNQKKMAKRIDTAMTATEVLSIDRQNNPRTSSAQVRLILWSNTLAMIMDHPLLGVGWGNFHVAFPAYSNAVIDQSFSGLNTQTEFAHNDYLNFAAESGLPGLVFFLSLLGLTLKAVLSRITSCQRSLETRLYLAVLLLPIVGILIDALFSFPLKHPVNGFTFLVILGLLLNLVNKEKYPVEIKSVHNLELCDNATGKYFLVAGFALCFLLAGFIHYRIAEADFYTRKAYIAGYKQNWETLEKWSSRSLNAFRWNRYNQFMRGKALFELGNMQACIEEMEQLKKAYPNQLNVIFILGNAYMESADYTAALAAFGEVLAKKPASHAAQNQIAIIYGKRNQHDLAYRHFLEAVRLDPGNYIYNLNLARAAIKQESRETAMQGLEMACQNMPHKAEIWLKYFEYLQGLQESRSLMEAIRESLNHLEKKEELLLLFSYCEQNGLFEFSVEILQKILQKESGNYELLALLSRQYYMSGDYDQAIRYQKEALEIRPENAVLYHDLAVIYYSMHSLEMAEQNYRAAVDLNPDYANAWFGLGATLASGKTRNSEARECFKKALQLNPEHPQKNEMESFLHKTRND